MTPGKGGDDKDSPLHFSGEIKDWPTFKEAIQSHADACDTTWLLEAGRALALFFARQIKDKTGSAATRKKALDREKVKTDSNHVPTSVDAYNDDALEEWFDDRDLATDLQLSLNYETSCRRYEITCFGMKQHQCIMTCAGMNYYV